MLDAIEEMNDVSTEAYKEYEVLKSEILDEVVDVSPRNCHEFSWHGYFDDQFDSVQGNLQLGQLSHGKIMTEYFESCHFFYDLVAEYIENIGSGNGWLYLYCKDQFLYYNFVPLGPSVLFFIKHEEKVVLCDHLLEWLHWKSEVT